MKKRTLNCRPSAEVIKLLARTTHAFTHKDYGTLADLVGTSVGTIKENVLGKRTYVRLALLLSIKAYVPPRRCLDARLAHASLTDELWQVVLSYQ